MDFTVLFFFFFLLFIFILCNASFKGKYQNIYVCGISSYTTYFVACFERVPQPEETRRLRPEETSQTQERWQKEDRAPPGLGILSGGGQTLRALAPAL